MQEKSVRISKEVYDLVKEVAEKEDRTITMVIRRAVKKYTKGDQNVWRN